MADELKQQLKQVQERYEKINEHYKKIHHLEDELKETTNKLSEPCPNFDYQENYYTEQENKRRKNEVNEKFKPYEEKSSTIGALTTIAILAAALIIGIVYAFNEFGGIGGVLIALLFSIIPLLFAVPILFYGIGFLISALLSVTYEKHYRSRFEKQLNGALLEEAKKKDRAAKEEYLKQCAEYKEEINEAYQQLSRETPQKIENLKHKIDMLVSESEAILALPDGHNISWLLDATENNRSKYLEDVWEKDEATRSLYVSIVIDELLSSYNNCKKEWFQGRDVKDLNMLIRYYNSYNQNIYDEKYMDAMKLRKRLLDPEYEALNRAQHAQAVSTAESKYQNQEAQKRHDRAEESLKNL